MAEKKNSNLISALLYIVVGILLCVFRSGMLDILFTVAGIGFIVFGALDILKKNFVSGAISAGIGLIILLGAWLFLKVILIVFGVLIAVKGLFALFDAIKKKAVIELVFAALSIVAGIFLAFGNALDWVIIIGGVILIIDGVMDILGQLGKSNK